MAHTAEKTIKLERLVADVETQEKIQKLEDQNKKITENIKRLERDIASLKEKSSTANGASCTYYIIIIVRYFFGCHFRLLLHVFGVQIDVFIINKNIKRLISLRKCHDRPILRISWNKLCFKKIAL